MNQAQFDNPYSAPQNSYEAAAAYSSVSERAAFIQRTYAHLTAAIFAFAAIDAVIFTLVPQQTLLNIVGPLMGGFSWLLLLGGFMVVSWVARSWAMSGASRGKQYAGLSLYVVAEALLFVPLLLIAQMQTGSTSLIASAGVITLVTFGGLTAVVFISKTDFSFMRMFLFWGGIIALGTVVAAAIFGFNLGVFFSVAMIALASGYILYDTSNVIHHYRTDQHVAASLALFASVALLFWYVLRLLMSLNND